MREENERVRLEVREKREIVRKREERKNNIVG